MPLYRGWTPSAPLLLAMAAALHSAAPAAAQLAGAESGYSHPADAPVARAVRTSEPIIIDGRLDEGAWQSAPIVTGFFQEAPDEGEPVSQRTEVRFLFDDQNLYVGARMWENVRVVGRLARRDTPTPDADFFAVILDSYHDHRTAYRMGVGPSGIRRDEIVVGERVRPGALGRGGSQDSSWDPVWEARTSIDADGWYAEMRIPFTQLRFGSADVQTWGLQMERFRRAVTRENAVWAFTPSRERGGVARYGHLEGLAGVRQGRPLQLLPYLSGRAEFGSPVRAPDARFDNPFRSGGTYFTGGGLDLKYRLNSNLTLDGTVNPDFGQVEMDPAVINLTAFETRFDERRPFFVEGAEIFRFGEPGGRPGPMDSQLIYSRRIGRAPQGGAPSSAIYAEAPGATIILGAAKLTGKTANGWSLGFLDAVTGREFASFAEPSGARERAEIEPLTNYLAGRLRRDMLSGAASAGIIATAVHRDLGDAAMRARLRSAGYSAGLDMRIDWNNREWTLAGELSPSYVTGDSRAIDATQRSSARYLQRPDAAHLDYDPAATSLTGVFGRVDLSKQAGLWRGRVMLTGITPGYEVNDLGFQLSADRLDLDSNFGYEQTQPGSYLRQWSVRLGPAATWNLGGEAQALALSLSGAGQLMGFQEFNWRVTRNFAAWNDRLTRGGPLTREPGGYSGNLVFGTDRRHPLQLLTNLTAGVTEADGSQLAAIVALNRRMGDFELQLGPNFRRTHAAAQYVATIDDPHAQHTYGRRYVFAPLTETTLGLDTRFNATFTPDLSFELYAQPFIASGNYGAFRELAAPRTFAFAEYGHLGTSTALAGGRVAVDPDGPGPAPVFMLVDPDFNFRSLLGNAVLRWEYRPGSTIYLVWQQLRTDRLSPTEVAAGPDPIGVFDVEREVRALFGVKPQNIFLIKLNYWLNP